MPSRGDVNGVHYRPRAGGRKPGAPRPAGGSAADLRQIVGRVLIDLVDPVAVKQMRMAAPAVQRHLRRVVVGVVVPRYVDRLAGRDVAVIFFLQCAAVVFEVVEDVERAMCAILDQTGAGLVRGDQRGQPGRVDLVLMHLGPAADGHQHVIRETTQIGRGRREVAVAEAAEGLVGKGVLLDAMEMIGHRHAAPAHAEGREDMALRPVEDPADLVPVGHVLKRDLLDRGAGDDQAVEFLAGRLDLLERAIEGLHVLGRGVLRLMRGDPDQLKVDLQRRRADQPGELVLGLDLLRHQVQQANAQWPDILRGGPPGRHHHHAFPRQDLECGEGFGKGDRHDVSDTCGVILK
ncbi:hypothetical protein SDC9_36586 [bioreactor metagenome]|uniref:Uncharacterized protein n=1 Tax=bioreactor metagenome TaxID=1076179 RepID=A0A644VGL0_9ZZZZ